MKTRLRLGVAILGLIAAFTLSRIPLRAQRSQLPLAGTWRVVSVETIRPNGEALTDWLGKRPTGTIVYLPSGYMAVQIMKDPRPLIGGTGYRAATPEEKVAALDGYYAYYGTYELNMTSRTVVHKIEASLRPNEVGIRYERHFEISGDHLTLTTPPFTESGEQRFNRLVWERIK